MDDQFSEEQQKLIEDMLDSIYKDRLKYKELMNKRYVRPSEEDSKIHQQRMNCSAMSTPINFDFASLYPNTFSSHYERKDPRVEKRKEREKKLKRIFRETD